MTDRKTRRRQLGARIMAVVLAAGAVAWTMTKTGGNVQVHGEKL